MINLKTNSILKLNINVQAQFPPFHHYSFCFPQFQGKREKNSFHATAELVLFAPLLAKDVCTTLIAQKNIKKKASLSNLCDNIFIGYVNQARVNWKYFFSRRRLATSSKTLIYWKYSNYQKLLSFNAMGAGSCKSFSSRRSNNNPTTISQNGE